MRRTDETQLSSARLKELALRAQVKGMPCFTPFLNPPEAVEACIAGKKEGVATYLFGGYEDAERQMACYAEKPVHHEAYPLEALEIRGPHQKAPAHRDLLGSVMGLGIQRHCVGDIVLQEECAYLFVTSAIVAHVMENLSQAGKTRLHLERLKELPGMAGTEGELRKDTVSSLRLDALVSSGFCMSRAKAAQLITTGHVKLRHIQTLRPDAHVEPEDIISVRGMGRLKLVEVGNPTRKERLPILIERFGACK